ncbi:MAG: hypothetical protein ABJJ48_05035, partial [Marinomonas sp.]
MRNLKLFSALGCAYAALILSAPASAQNEDVAAPVAEGQPVETIAVEGDAADDDGPLRGTVTDDSDWKDIGIAIPGFATNRNAPTPANSSGTAALGKEIARVITANLRN